MFDKVMIGIDEHEGGRDAIALARQLVSEDGELTLAYVHGGFPIVSRGSSGAFEAAERERAHEVLTQAKNEAGIDARLCSIGETSVGRGLHKLAERHGADLLVIGSNRRGLFGRVLVGDDTSHSLNGAPCAVAVAPAGYAEHPKKLTEIGVAFNESDESVHALSVARALAAQRGAKLSAFEAVSLPQYLFLGGPMPVDDALEQYVEDTRERISELKEVDAHVTYGYAVEELTVYSASVDLLVVGSRDYGPVGRLMHGSTSHQLARTARCPLLVLTRAKRPAHADAEATDDVVAVGA
jgi:nucleotide-binding universal stress UspA family protein